MSIHRDLFLQMFASCEYVILHLYWTTFPFSKEEVLIYAEFWLLKI